jgi:hypothetical protein
MAPGWEESKAFDMATAPVTVPLSAHTKLLQHFWGPTRDNPPTFAEVKTAESPINTFTLANLNPEAVVFHRNKDGTLLKLLGFKSKRELDEQWADVVSLRRAGDIIALLPLLKVLSEKESRKIRLVVHKDFLPLLDGVSYVEGVPWDGEWENPMAAAKHYGATNAQVYGRGLNPDLGGGNFAAQAWNKLGAEWNAKLPLVFDRRDLGREQELANSVFRTNKPKLLLKLHGFSSPFMDSDFVTQKVNQQCGQFMEIVSLDEIKAERIYDLIGLMDRAELMVTIDTVTLWLAHASDCPTVAFTNGNGFSASPSRGNCLLRMPYNEVKRKWVETGRVISKIIQQQQRGSRIQQFQTA